MARKPFKHPCHNGYSDPKEFVRRLSRKRFVVPWGSTRPALIPITNHLDVQNSVEKDVKKESEALPPGIEPLVLWQPYEFGEECGDSTPIVVDPLLVCFLWPHQGKGELKKVISHPLALAHCGKTLAQLGLDHEAVEDTVGVVEIVLSNKMLDTTAIASSQVALLYGLDVLAHGVQNGSWNVTRFLILSKDLRLSSPKEGTSLD
ncbi:Dna repair and recombination protein rad54 [Thalictrum thalictroides]|uniref:Dna repair and recombination protein rad54 n=1 Tax=Thalictrum thalictroides TaxID=46969 RepID=A0A7J6UYX8_THATH|nr:Dna repair and recombination protein rad54 [Thalictrum thalictroides]